MPIRLQPCCVSLTYRHSRKLSVGLIICAGTTQARRDCWNKPRRHCLIRPLIRYHLGMSYIGGGQMGKASEQLKKALELTPDEGLEKKIREAQQKTEKSIQN